VQSCMQVLHTSRHARVQVSVSVEPFDFLCGGCGRQL